MSCGRRPAPRNVVKWDVGRPAPRPPRTFAVMRSPADCVVGGGGPGAPGRCGVGGVGPRLGGGKSGSEQGVPLQGKQPHERASFAGGRRALCAVKRSRPLPTMQRIKGVVMARLRAGHARPLQTTVNGSRTRGAREGGSPAHFRVRRLPGNGRPRTARRNPPVR